MTDFDRSFSEAEIRAFVAERREPARGDLHKGRTRLSVVLPSYNQGAFIRRTLNSIANQHYENLQLIVMDGGSSDGSQSVINEYSDILDHFESGPDGGQAAAINRGFSQASGDFLAWQNSDDLYLPGFFRTIDAALERYPDSDLIIANSYVIGPEENVLWSTRYGPFSTAYLAYVGWNLTSQSVFVRRSLAERVGPLPDYDVAFDYEWFLKVARDAKRVLEMKRYGGCYRVHPASKLSVADRDARADRERNILRSLGYRLDPARPVDSQWRWRRSALKTLQNFNSRLFYSANGDVARLGRAWARALSLRGRRLVGYY